MVNDHGHVQGYGEGHVHGYGLLKIHLKEEVIMCHRKFMLKKVYIWRKKLPCVTESLRTFRSAREREGRAQAEVLYYVAFDPICRWWLLMKVAFKESESGFNESESGFNWKWLLMKVKVAFTESDQFQIRSGDFADCLSCSSSWVGLAQ